MAQKLNNPDRRLPRGYTISAARKRPTVIPIAICTTEKPTLSAMLFSVVPAVTSAELSVVAFVVFRVIWSAELSPETSDPVTERPEGTCTKMAGSMAAAARP